MKRIPMVHDWTMSHTAGPRPAGLDLDGVPASVPGSVHTDLLAAGLITDPYLDSNEAQQAWIGQSDWRYATAFEWRRTSERSELVFEGLDTVATVSLNGRVVLAAENMHRTYRADVTDLLEEGSNSLTVGFSSAVREADRRSLELGARPHANHHPYNALRKMACGFGWDWGPDTATAGIWRPALLEEWSTARLVSVRPVATVEGADGLVTVHVDVDRTGNEPLVVVARVGAPGGGAVTSASVALGAGGTSSAVVLSVPEPELWWPRGYGEPALHDLTIELSTAGDEGRVPLDSWSGRIGFRTVTLTMPADAAGVGFGFEVNGRPVFVKGANWIPDDAFPHRVDRARYVQRIRQATDAGFNLLRVWGGGIYESEDFYSLCDEAGLLTWQDFLLACAAYSEDEPLRSEIEAEAREAVARLAAHPSLVLLNGNNENLWGFRDWNWEHLLDGRTWGADYYYQLFPGLVAELAAHVPYTPGSPFTPVPDGEAPPGPQPNDPSRGTMHIWDLWNDKDYVHYRDYQPRFVAEFGWQGPPAWSTLTAAVSDSPLTPESPGMIAHQKASDGYTKLTRGLVPHLPVPQEMHDWHWAMQLNQANAVRTAIEWFRSLAPHCTGSIVWQLNDCWPVTSWAAVDGDGRKKPLYAAVRAANADRLLTVQPLRSGQGLRAAAVNDTDVPWTGALSLERRMLSGEVLAAETALVTVPARGSFDAVLPESVQAPDYAAAEMVVAELDGARALWFFAEYRDQSLEEDRFTADLERQGDALRLRITARTLLRDVTVLADKLDPDATVDRALATLLPGETAEFFVITDAPLTLDELTSREVLRTANQLVHPRRG
ncbi:glycoside hydrolase family 2 protein [Sinomonas sp. ASV486]|uniref:glycoside hydrolase family 2 protein n=1 Tax=Sinomonas sp. ASV486 TaxID=3051170 RepID=UPI0027DBE645|nr:glycoside hydrolase family 2 protein [Sinomonas sp. ASV486]MDQ4489339.1 glycoside hydrolase family 2 protein [Sinomonas sp. ASV486]